MQQKVLFIILGSLLLLSFQNCQPTKFVATADLSASADGTGTGAGDAANGNVVGNDVIYKLEPALAIRGMGCIQCHGNFDSNILTDFGLNGNDQGQDYYFNQQPAENWWKSGGIYGDHAKNFNTMVFPAGKSVVVPKAALPAVVDADTPGDTLADYIRSQFSIAADEGTKQTQVLEKSKVYIGAPTEADLIAAFSLGAGERLKYLPAASDSVPLSGLQDHSSFFQNSSVLACEGDLILRGPLLLQNLQVNSRTGCRIHVIGSVFLYGSLTFVNSDENRNIQIMSTKSINMGLGLAKTGDSYCEPNGRWATNKGEGSYANGSSLLTRYRDNWTVRGQFVRQNTDPLAFGNSVIAEAQLIETMTGTLYDAACRAEGRNVSFERIVLNAPAIHSRYEGNVTGTLIAEYALMSLGTFKFKFDPVFIRVPMFPKVSKKLYLEVID